MSTKLVEVIGKSSITPQSIVRDNNQRSTLIITDNNRGTTVTVTPKSGNNITVSTVGAAGTQGPQGPQGPAGPAGSVRPYIATGSVSASVSIGSNIFFVNSGNQTFLNLTNQGSFTVASSAQNAFLIKNITTNASLLTVSQSGVVIFKAHSTNPIGTTVPGSIYFTSSSLFIGVE